MKELSETEQLKNGRFLLAFSGGPDSVYLLYRLSLFYKEELKDKVALCYINYHDSPFVDQEENIVSYYVNQYHLRLFRKDVYYKKEKDHNFEDWARNYRYQFFSQIVKEEGYQALLTAHQKSDHIETYLLQKERGNLPLHYGLPIETTLYGIKILRPLLSVSKKEIIEELKEINFPYYDDITNQDVKKKRNFLRKQLENKNEEDNLKELNQENERLTKLYSFFRNHPLGMDYPEYESLSEEEKKRYCFYLLDAYSLSQKREGQGKKIYDFLKKQEEGKLPIQDEFVLYRRKDYFFLSKSFEKLSYEYQVNEATKLKTPFFEVDLSKKDLFRIPDFPITIRNYQKGDRLSSGFPIKDIEEFLLSQDVPRYLFPLYPVFLYHDKIFFVPFYQDIKKQKIPMKLCYTKGLLQ